MQSQENNSNRTGDDEACEIEAPIRLLQIVFSLEPGGMENGVINLSNGLDPRFFQIGVACLEIPGGFASRLRDDILVESCERRFGFDLRAAWRLGRLIHRWRPDVLHTHNLGPLIYAVIARAFAGRFTPILHGEHGVFQGDSLDPRRLRQRKWLYRICARIHTVSASLRDYLVGLGFPDGKMVTILNGVDCDRFSPPDDRAERKRRQGLPEDSLVVGIVGRLAASKRHDLFLGAIERLPGEIEGRAVHALIVGDGGDHRDAVVEAIERHPAGARLHWMGHQDDPVACYRAMDLLVMPSAVEGLSNALLESMACGVPCIAHPACGASEVIDDGRNGWLAEMATGEQLAECLEALLKDGHSLLEVGAVARETAVQRFSLDAMVARYGELFGELARGRWWIGRPS